MDSKEMYTYIRRGHTLPNIPGSIYIVKTIHSRNQIMRDYRDMKLAGYLV